LTTLTKVFIVVLTVFAIAFSMLVIGYAAQSKNYKDLSDKNHDWALQESASRQADNNLSKVTAENYQKQMSSLQDQLGEIREAMESNANQMASVKNELLAEKQKTASLTGQVTQLTSMLDAGDAERKELQTQLGSLRKDNSALRTDNFSLTQINQKLDLQQKLYEQEIRLLKEQNYSLSERVEALRAKIQTAASGNDQGSSVAGAEAIAGSASSAIIGEITSVRDALASISIGSAQGVKSGMVFTIYRGSTYLGKLQITQVQPELSAGELMQVQGRITSGDKVSNSL
jgi:uncharacterized protein (DUF3084 family)